MKDNPNSETDSVKQGLIQAALQELETGFIKLKQGTAAVGSDIGLAGGQIFLLSMLQRSGICKATDAATRLGITSGAVTGMLDKLESMDLIRRERSTEDRRVVLLTLTEQGTAAIEHIRSVHFAKLRKALEIMEAEELETFIRLFGKFKAALE